MAVIPTFDQAMNCELSFLSGREVDEARKVLGESKRLIRLKHLPKKPMDANSVMDWKAMHVELRPLNDRIDDLNIRDEEIYANKRGPR